MKFFFAYFKNIAAVLFFNNIFVVSDQDEESEKGAAGMNVVSREKINQSIK